ncbi:MAG: hypothetical protein IKR23_02990 [Lachnospiraceae bacterium]|nr:hypothetical protein [Lachnospiraceae bacterium]
MKNKRRKLRSLLSWILTLTMLLGTLGGDRIPALAGDNVPVPVADALDGDGGDVFTIDVSSSAVSIGQVSAQKVYRTLKSESMKAYVGEDEFTAGYFYVNVNPEEYQADDDDLYGGNDITFVFYDQDGKCAEEPAYIAYAVIYSIWERDITQAEYTLEVSDADESIYSSLHFTFYNSIQWSLNLFDDYSEEIDEAGFIKDGVLVPEIENTYVKHGEKLNTVISAFPDARYNDMIPLYWADILELEMDQEPRKVTLDMTVSEDMCVGPVWGKAPHDHHYHESVSGNVSGQVSWNWIGSDDTGYMAKVTLYCISENCPSENRAPVTVSADVTVAQEKVSGNNICYKERNVYTATAEYDGNTYTDTCSGNYTNVDHRYHASTSENIPGEVEWTWTGSDADGYTAKVTIYCINNDCMDPDHAKKVLSANVAESDEKATCTKGVRKCWAATASFDGVTYINVKDAAQQGEPFGHIWKFDTASENVVWYGNDVDGYTGASITKECQSLSHNEAVDGPKEVSVSVDVTVSNNNAKCGETAITYYTAVFDSNVDPDIKEAFSFRKVVSGNTVSHSWVVKTVSSNGSFYTAPTEAWLTIVCEKDKSETEVVSVSASGISIVSENELHKIYKYTGKTSDGQEVSDTEEFLNHSEHVWDVKFDWKNVSVNKANTIVTAEATCKNGGEKKALEVTLEDKTIGSKIEYLAKATDLNGKVWTSKKNIDTKTGVEKDGPAGTPSVEGGDIVIIGLEETYPYTGSKIKPAVTVMDGDIVLAQSTDYTVSYTGKNKIGEINKVEVKGKGNYAGKSATAQFKIVDPRDDVDKDKLADKVSKVSVNIKKFTYNGKAQYPSEVTVTLKDKSTIVYKVEEDGSFTTESEKEVGLSFSNNINKGTATVAAIGSDGKVKKASYTIAAAEIGSAEFEISAVDWAVKAATPEIKATIKLGDEDVELVAGQDYKVSFKAKEAGENKGTAKISGKGNFKGKHADVTYTVTPMEITENNIVVKALSGKKAKDVKVIVNDAFGNALNKKFYTVEIQNAEGTALNKGDALTEEIKVVVKGANAAVTTGEDGVTVDVKPAADIAKVKGAFKVDKNFFKTYTGEPITLDADDFVSGKINVGTLELGKDFNIVAYKNNIKKGTMTVTVQGDGEYSGTKTFKVKIKAKPFDKLAPEN